MRQQHIAFEHLSISSGGNITKQQISVMNLNAFIAWLGPFATGHQSECISLQ